MYIFFDTNTGQCMFFIDFFIINRGRCIFFIDSFLSLIEVNVYFVLTLFYH